MTILGGATGLRGAPFFPVRSNGASDVNFLRCNRSRSHYVQSNMNRISASTWAEIRTAYASGIGLREMARNMDIPAGTVLARSKREGWTQQIATAKLIQRPELARELAKPDAINAITPMQSAAISAQERKQGLLAKALRIADKAADRIEDQIDTANISQATIAFGVSTEKALLLAGEPPVQVSIYRSPPRTSSPSSKPSSNNSKPVPVTSPMSMPSLSNAHPLPGMGLVRMGLPRSGLGVKKRKEIHIRSPRSPRTFSERCEATLDQTPTSLTLLF